MARQVINIGNSPGDLGDGDPIRSAFQKSNANFAELYDLTSNSGTTGILTSIDYFSISDQQTGPFTSNELIVEKNTSIDQLYFDWQITRNPNQIIQSQRIDITGGNSTSINTAITEATITGPFTQNTEFTYTLVGPNFKGSPLFTLSKTASLKFQYKIFAGSADSDNLTDPYVLVNKNDYVSNFVTDKVQEVTYFATGSQQTNGRYPYYFYPAVYGPLSNVMVNGFPFNDLQLTTTPVTVGTGQSAQEVLYNVYRFTNRQYGQSIKVNWA